MLHSRENDGQMRVIDTDNSINISQQPGDGSEM